MKMYYDPDADTLKVLFSNKPIERRVMAESALIFYGEDGRIIGFELQEASTQVENPLAAKVEMLPENMKPKELDWEKASAEEIIAELRASRIESGRDWQL